MTLHDDSFSCGMFILACLLWHVWRRSLCWKFSLVSSAATDCSNSSRQLKETTFSRLQVSGIDVHQFAGKLKPSIVWTECWRALSLPRKRMCHERSNVPSSKNCVFCCYSDLLPSFELCGNLRGEMSPSPVLSSLSERRVCGPTASLFGRGGIKGDLHLFAVLHLRCSSPLCSLSCHPHRFFLLCRSGGWAALLLPYLGGVASKVIFISLFYLFLCTTLVLVYLTLSPWIYLDIHIRGYITFWWPSCCLWIKFQWTMQHPTLG